MLTDAYQIHSGNKIAYNYSRLPCMFVSYGQLVSLLYNRAHFLSLAQSKFRLCSVNHRPCYWSNLACDWPSTAWVNSKLETENGPRFGLELLHQFPPFCWFPPVLSKQWLLITYHVLIWQMSPQLSCNCTHQIWKWFNEYNRYFCKSKNFINGKIDAWRFSNPHPLDDSLNPQCTDSSALVTVLCLSSGA